MHNQGETHGVFMHRRHHTLIAAAVALSSAACLDGRAPIDLVNDRTRTSAALRTYESCDALGTDLRAHTRDRARTMLLQQREQLRSGGYWFGGVDGAPEAEGDSSNDGGTRTEGVDFSGTNNQEDGVDEAHRQDRRLFHLHPQRRPPRDPWGARVWSAHLHLVDDD
jgi:hypothetical protein